MKVLKKTILIFGVVNIALVIFVNLIFNINFSPIGNERIEFFKFSIGTLIALITTIGIILCFYLIILKLIKNKSKKFKMIVVIVLLVISFIVQIIFGMNNRMNTFGDNGMVYNMARVMHEKVSIPSSNNINTDISYYVSKYPQQLSLAFMESIVMNIFHSEEKRIFLIINSLLNCLTIIDFLLIFKELSKNHKVNKTLGAIIIFTFVQLNFLATFIYGDVPSFAFGFLAFYFALKYGNTNKNRYLFFSSIFMSIAYICRENTLIMILAEIFYLILNLKNNEVKTINERENKKQKVILKEKISKIILKFLLILCFAFISILPGKIICNYEIKKYNLDKNNKITLTSYLLMGMGYNEEETAGPGWYDIKITDNQKVSKREDYVIKENEQISERLEYLRKNPIHAIKFYLRKFALMWAENTYSTIRVNTYFDTKKYLDGSSKISRKNLIIIQFIVYIYGKAILLVISLGTLIYLVKNKNNLSNDVLLFVILFIGGFLFYVLWEAKSRYIIPYVLALIPSAVVGLNDQFEKIELKIKEQKNKNKLLKIL